MKKRSLIAAVLLILFTTITINLKIVGSKFNLKVVNIENNFLLDEKEIKELLDPIYNENLIFLKNSKIANLLTKNTFIESFKINKNGYYKI